MRNLLGILILLLGLALPGCSHLGHRVEKPVTLKKSNHTLDGEVLTTVLDDLLSSTSKELAILSLGAQPRTLLFAATPVKWQLTLNELTDRSQQTLWAKLTSAKNSAFQEAAQNLLSRLNDPVSFRSVKEKNKRIHLYEELSAKEKAALSLFDRPVVAWPPGYSQDRQFAVVQLSIPTGPHSAHATYFLAWSHGRWEIVVRQFVYSV
jgi:hypothetical protein